jgi:hypothetical protein
MPGVSLRRRGLFGLSAFAEDFTSDPLSRYTLVPGPSQNGAASYDAPNHRVVGGGTGGLPLGLSAYYLTAGTVGDADYTSLARHTYQANECPAVLFYNPVNGWWVSAGYGYSIFSGNAWVQFSAYNNAGSVQASNQLLINGFPQPGSTQDFSVRVTKIGNVVRCRLYISSPSVADADASWTLPATPATNLGSGVTTKPGWAIGRGDFLMAFSGGPA